MKQHQCLTQEGRNEVLDVVRELKEKEKLTIISITHDLEEAARADRIIVMNQGQKYIEKGFLKIFLRWMKN